MGRDNFFLGYVWSFNTSEAHLHRKTETGISENTFRNHWRTMETKETPI